MVTGRETELKPVKQSPPTPSETVTHLTFQLPTFLASLFFLCIFIFFVCVCFLAFQLMTFYIYLTRDVMYPRNSKEQIKHVDR